MRKFKLKRTYRKERAAWVDYALSLVKDVEHYRDQILILIEERNAVQRDFEYMEKRYRNV